MVYNTIDPRRTDCYWDQDIENFITMKRPVVIHLDAESIHQEFEVKLTEAARYFAYTGDGITFDFRGNDIWLPDFYPGKKYEKYTEARLAMPKFINLKDWYPSRG